jgi:hypothetical protein
MGWCSHAVFDGPDLEQLMTQGTVHRDRTRAEGPILLIKALRSSGPRCETTLQIQLPRSHNMKMTAPPQEMITL